MPDPVRTYQEALDVCAADGASLPKLLTRDDVLAVKHYMNSENIDNAWTSLMKVNSSITCTDSTCDGVLEWAGGLAFSFDASTVRYVHAPDGSDFSCIIYRVVQNGLADVRCNATYRAICQFTPLQVPADYEFRNGNYYKVIHLKLIWFSYHSLNMNIWIPKFFGISAAKDWKSANTVCNNDGGSLMSVITQDDKSALTHYSNIPGAGQNIWVGLRMIEATNCNNDLCDGKLRWIDGNQFVYDSLMYDNVTGDVATQNHRCFVRNGPNKEYVLGNRNANRQFLCRIPLCSGT